MPFIASRLSGEHVIKVLLAVVGISAQVASAGEVEEIQQGVIANRMAIRRWHVSVSFHASVRNDAGQLVASDRPLDATVYFESYVDGARQRLDVRSRYREQERFPELDSDEYWHYRIWGDDEIVSWGTQEFPGSSVAINVRERVANARPGVEGHGLLNDIRWLGWHSDHGLMQQEPKEFFADPQFVEWKVEDAECRGIACRRLEWRRNTGRDEGSMWVASEMGFSVLRSRFEGRDEDPVLIQQADFEVEQWQDSGIWYPVSSVREVYVDGDVIRREEVTYEIVALNEDLDAELFTLAALNPPGNERVFISPKPSSAPTAKYLWNGSEIVEVETGGSLNRGARESATGRYRWLLIANAFVFTVVCVICVWRAFGRRSV